MADRIALAIEPDKDTANQIRRLLEPKGFQVESIPNGDDAMEWGRTNKPAVIILSVEPRKVGYAISNKLRRSPSLSFSRPCRPTCRSRTSRRPHAAAFFRSGRDIPAFPSLAKRRGRG